VKPIISGLPPALHSAAAHADAADTESNTTNGQVDDPAAKDETKSSKDDHDAIQRPATIGKTRAQVRAELAEAKAAGQVTYGEQAYPVTLPSSAPGKTREQIRAELAQAKAAGQVTYGEQEYPTISPSPEPTKTRAQVRAELAQAKAEGLVTYGEQDYPPTPKPAAAQPQTPSHSSVVDKLSHVIKQLLGHSK